MFKSSQSQEAKNKDESKGDREGVGCCCGALYQGILEFQVYKVENVNIFEEERRQA